MYPILKWLMDIGFAVVAIVFFWWLFLLCAIAVALSSNGPVLFVQRRIGREGKPFVCYKFRTMHVGTQEAGTHEISADAVTKFGRVLRRTRLDELPQVINILRGQMSLIGPRPCLETQTDLIGWRQRFNVFSVKPGISGLAQIQGVDMSDPEKLARIDGEYVLKRNLVLDIKIALATVTGKGLNDYVKA